jgi:hypothetical protein
LHRHRHVDEEIDWSNSNANASRKIPRRRRDFPVRRPFWARSKSKFEIDIEIEIGSHYIVHHSIMLRFSLTVLCLFAFLNVSKAFVIDFGYSKKNRRIRTVVHSSVKPENIKEIKTELKRLGVSYKDCFDKESLIQRYKEAQEGKIKTSETKEATTTTDAGPSSSSSSSFDRDAALRDLRAKRISELREECAKRRIRWGNFVEKEDMIQAIAASMEDSSAFSANLSPGVATSITGDQLKEELETPHSTPLLLDIYATWWYVFLCCFCRGCVPWLTSFVFLSQRTLSNVCWSVECRCRRTGFDCPSSQAGFRQVS